MMRLDHLRLVLVVSLGALLLCSALATNAGARGTRHADPNVREDVVEAIDLAHRTVTIAGQEYIVSDASRLMNERGGRIHLRELRDTRTTGEGDMVEYLVRDDRAEGPPEIRYLKVLEGEFE